MLANSLLACVEMSSSPPCLHLLPEELLLTLARYLGGQDLLSLSHACKRLLDVLRSDLLWNKVIRKEEVAIEETVRQFADNLADELQIPVSEEAHLI